VKRLAGFGRFWWDFIVGDDWTVAVFVVVAVGVTVVLERAGHPAWWFLPIVVAVGLTSSLWRATRPKGDA
jgi:hypothetical protein